MSDILAGEELLNHNDSLVCEEYLEHHDALTQEERPERRNSIAHEERLERRDSLTQEGLLNHSDSLACEEHLEHRGTLTHEECPEHRDSLTQEGRLKHRDSLTQEGHLECRDTLTQEEPLEHHGALTYEEYLDSYGSLTYTNVGTSMLPLLREGRDLFTVVPKTGRCAVGDVVLYRRPPSKWVIHRVVGLRPDGYLMLGDNCVVRERVAEEDVIGVMCSFARGGHGGRMRTHSVDELGYRAYTRFVLVSERPRVLLRRTLAVVRHLAGRLRHAR